MPIALKPIALMLFNLCLGAAVAMVAGCQNRTSNRTLQIVSAARAQELIEGTDRLIPFGGERATIWLDPRTNDAYQAEHIPGAVNLPYQHINRDQELLREYDLIIVYGDDYNDPKAQGMSKRLLEFGYGSVYTLEGGLREWKLEGNPTETGEGSLLGEG